MKYLFDHLATLEASLEGKHIVVLLDFDGTLSPIEATPDAATLPDETRRELERLAGGASCSLAVVSGRALEDIRDKVGLPGIIYVGNHGLEMARPNEAPRSAVLGQYLASLATIKEELARRLTPFAGVIIEDKKYGVAIHYRMVAAGERHLIRDVVDKVVRAYGGEDTTAVSTGAMVVELRPSIGRDKGTVVSELLASEMERRGRAGAFALYVGDDATDEDAFKAIRGRGWGILVGAPRISYAEYYVNDPNEVRRLLRLIAMRCEERR